MNILKLPKRIYSRIKKEQFIKKFKKFDISAGCEKSCSFIGEKSISVGQNSYFGDNCEIIAIHSHHGNQIFNPGLIIGENVRITSRCRITCADRIEIGNCVLMAPDVFITDHNHGMNPTIKSGYSPQNLVTKSVKIGEGVWLGQRVIVLPGVEIGEHSIIGAASVVTKDIPSYSIAVGNPARVVKKWDFESGTWVKI